MAKSLIKVALTGRLVDDTIAKTHQADDVDYFRDVTNSVSIKCCLGGKTLIAITNKGQFELQKHQTNNYYHGIQDGYKIQVTLRKIVGELRYWG